MSSICLPNRTDRRRLTVWPRHEAYDGVAWVVSHGPSILAVVASLAEAERIAALISGRAGQ